MDDCVEADSVVSFEVFTEGVDNKGLEVEITARTQSIEENFGSVRGPKAVSQRGISIKTKAPFLLSPIEDMVDMVE